MRSRTGIAGCGRMGAPMLEALRAAGLPARGYDVVPMDSPHITDDIAVFSEDLDTLITVVRDVAQTEALLFGAQNLTEIPTLIRILICSTLSPRYVRALRMRIPAHIALIDAPMSGAQIAAREARLSFMLGGDAADIDGAMPLLRAMGKHFHRMGDFGAGMQAKGLNNLLAASNTAMTRLVLDWADDAGLDTSALLDLIHTSSGQNWFATGFNAIEFARDGFAEGNTIGILVKDIASALDAAPRGADTSLPQAVQSSIARLRPRPKKS
jgi:3-hydroxyisobutyrate dehydrogenase-like beta-hydroxyacid dehydrogenase